MATPAVKYKICKNCGNRNHPDSGQCAWCGAALRRPLDWFSTVGMTIIVLIIVGLVVYAIHTRTPSGAKMRLPSLGQTAE
jgi:hypothetical protein